MTFTVIVSGRAIVGGECYVKEPSYNLTNPFLRFPDAF